MVIWGHFARDCRLPPRQSNYKTPALSQGSSQKDQKKKVVPAKTGRVNYTALEEVPEGTQVMAGMFSINHRPAIVLFDLGASHTFISQACVERLNLQETQLTRNSNEKTLCYLCTGCIVAHPSNNSECVP